MTYRPSLTELSLSGNSLVIASSSERTLLSAMAVAGIGMIAYGVFGKSESGEKFGPLERWILTSSGVVIMTVMILLTAMD